MNDGFEQGSAELALLWIIMAKVGARQYRARFNGIGHHMLCWSFARSQLHAVATACTKKY